MQNKKEMEQGKRGNFQALPNEKKRSKKSGLLRVRVETRKSELGQSWTFTETKERIETRKRNIGC